MTKAAATAKPIADPVRPHSEAAAGDRPCAACTRSEDDALGAAPDAGHQFGDVSVLAPVIQRAVDDPAATEPATEAAPETATDTGGLLVDDDASALQPGQTRKTEFLQALRPAVCASADRELARAGRDTAGCPYLDRWFDYYQGRDAAHVERSLRKYAPGAATATSARDYIAPVADRVAQGVQRWVETGQVPELPDGLSPDLAAGGGVLGAVASVGQAIASGVAAVGNLFGRLFFQAKPGGVRQAADGAAAQAQLGTGQPLASDARARMGAAFGHDFSHVRVHAEPAAANAASALDAHAFTIGHHIAFAPDQYRPGTLAGDALLAHELTHVVQQADAPTEAAAAPADAVELDADAATASVMQSLWSDGQRQDQPQRVEHRSRLRSGLALSRCARQAAPPQLPTALAAPPVAPGPAPAQTRLQQCGTVTPGMPTADRDHIIDCRRHENFLEVMQRSIARMRTVATPYAPGLAALYDAVLTQLLARPITEPPPRPGTPVEIAVSNVPVRVSASTTLTAPAFRISLRVLGTGAENGSFLGDRLELNEESASAVRYGANMDRDAAQRDIERTMYHEGVHFLSSLVIDANRNAPAGSAPVEPELGNALLATHRQQFETATRPYWDRIVQEPTAVDPATGAPPTAARRLVLARLYASLSWEKVANETITRVEEQLYLAARDGRGFGVSDVATFPQPWIETAGYWPTAGGLGNAELQAFLTRESAGIRRDVLPVVHQIQRDFLAQRPQP